MRTLTWRDVSDSDHYGKQTNFEPERCDPSGHAARPAPSTGAYRSGICQSISFLPAFRSASLILEKGRLLKNPFLADSGEG